MLKNYFFFASVKDIEDSNDGDGNERVLCVLKQGAGSIKKEKYENILVKGGENTGLPRCLPQNFTTFYAWL